MQMFKMRLSRMSILDFLMQLLCARTENYRCLFSSQPIDRKNPTSNL